MDKLQLVETFYYYFLTVRIVLPSMLYVFVVVVVVVVVDVVTFDLDGDQGDEQRAEERTWRSICVLIAERSTFTRMYTT